MKRSANTLCPPPAPSHHAHTSCFSLLHSFLLPPSLSFSPPFLLSPTISLSLSLPPLPPHPILLYADMSCTRLPPLSCSYSSLTYHTSLACLSIRSYTFLLNHYDCFPVAIWPDCFVRDSRLMWKRSNISEHKMSKNCCLCIKCSGCDNTRKFISNVTRTCITVMLALPWLRWHYHSSPQSFATHPQ